MIISHDRQTLFIGVPKNGSQTARAVLRQIGIDLVGEMGWHPTVPEAIRLAEERFPGQKIAPMAIFAFWRDPVERFCSAVEFHKRCLPNSFIQLFPERFAGIEPHWRWFEPDAMAVNQDLRSLIDNILPIEILAALPPPSIPGAPIQPRRANLSFYRTQSEWLAHPGVTVLPFKEYEISLRKVVSLFGEGGMSIETPLINAAQGELPKLVADEVELVRSYFREEHGDETQARQLPEE